MCGKTILQRNRPKKRVPKTHKEMWNLKTFIHFQKYIKNKVATITYFTIIF